MSPITVDMTGIGSREPLAPGYYEAVVESIEQKTSKSSNAPTLAWRFSIIEGEREGSKAFMHTSLTKVALWKLKEVLEALGYDEGDLKESVTFEPSDLIGMQCTLVVVEDEYLGQTVGRVDKVLPANSQPD